MILFIAMVLVAAVASAVLISTSNSVREQATQTGSAAIYGTAAGFNVENVWGTSRTMRSTSSMYISALFLVARRNVSAVPW